MTSLIKLVKYFYDLCPPRATNTFVDLIIISLRFSKLRIYNKILKI